MYKIKGGESFHLIALQSPVCGIVNLFKIGLVAECRIFGQLCNGSLGHFYHIMNIRWLQRFCMCLVCIF